MTFPVPKLAGGVVALSQSPIDGDILVIYGSGLFRRWDVKEAAAEAEFDFVAASRRAVNFTTDGTLAVAPGRLDPDSRVSGYTVWSTDTGEPVKCSGAHCLGASPQQARFTNLGVFLSGDGEWIVEYGGRVLGADSLSGDIHSIIDLYDYGLYRDYNVKRVAFDPSGEYMAYALREGQVRVYVSDRYLGRGAAADVSSRPSQSPANLGRGSRTYGNYESFARVDTADLEIDFTRRWLAWLTDSKLVVWDMRKTLFASQIEIPIVDGNALAFDRRGALLAVGRNSGIVVLDLNRREKVAEFASKEVTAIYFSNDNRMLIWGDSAGNIHLWGVRK